MTHRPCNLTRQRRARRRRPRRPGRRSTATRSACGSSAATTGSRSWARPTATVRSSRSSSDPDAPSRPRGTTGLFHLALLVPDRAELARALHRVTDAGYRFTGASDHLVSEALYLDDPEGNGIEIYRDRPRDEWAAGRRGAPDGDAAARSRGRARERARRRHRRGDGAGHAHRPRAPAGRASIPEADDFYIGGLGFDPVVRGYPGALFVSAGGYHHHIGLNTWAGEGAPPPPPGARGLRSFTIVLPDEAALQQTLAAAREAGIEAGEDADGRTVVADPSGNRAVRRRASPSAVRVRRLQLHQRVPAAEDLVAVEIEVGKRQRVDPGGVIRVQLTGPNC